jgi:hypothetical protein
VKVANTDMRYGMLAVACVAAASAGSAEGADLLTRLHAAKSLRCELGKGSQASWEGGALKLKEVEWGEGGTVVFDSIDPVAGKARMIGNLGAGDVAASATSAGLTFIEQTGLGSVNVMTVFARTSGGRFIAVLSRHQLWEDPRPSQFHALCSILADESR